MAAIITPYSIRLGVAGAGTMGSGIALAALLGGLRVTLYDLEPAALERARGYISAQLERKDQLAGLNRLALTARIEDLAGAGVVIEAAAEDLAVKQALFARLDTLCPPPAVLASNTSTLPVTAIAAGTAHPERVAGMHFFNPAPVMALVEIVRAAQTAQPALDTLLELAALMGKQPVVTADTPGFIVNRVARPFYGEALRLLDEGAASVTAIDHIVRLGGGFRMGPFELMDLIGIDINLAATRSLYEQSFGEPRYRPHPMQARLVQQNRLGRKTGHGFYPGGQPAPLPELPARRAPARKNWAALLITAGTFAPGLGALARQSGLQVSAQPQPGERHAPALAAGVVAAGQSEGLRRRLVELDDLLPPDLPLLCQCADITLSEAAGWVTHPERLVGFDGLFIANGPAATLTSVPGLSPQVRQAVEALVNGLGRVAFWVADTPALVLPRIVGQLINEAVFAVAAGVAEPGEIDRAMQSGANYPRGLLGWARTVGYERVLAVLDHLRAEYGEERYRAAALLRRWARLSAIDI